MQGRGLAKCKSSKAISNTHLRDAYGGQAESTEKFIFRGFRFFRGQKLLKFQARKTRP
jgi:hypothetical protein